MGVALYIPGETWRFEVQYGTVDGFPTGRPVELGEKSGPLLTRILRVALNLVHLEVALLLPAPAHKISITHHNVGRVELLLLS
jgi:hypothetical protein